MNRSLGHRAPLLWLVLPFVAGLSAGHAGLAAPRWWLLGAAMILAGVTVLSTWRWAFLWAPSLTLAMVAAGLASYGLNRPRLDAWSQLPIREARLSLRVDRLFSASDPKKASGIGTVAHADDHLRELVGQRVYFSLTLRTPAARPIRSAVIAAVGVIAPLPRNPPIDTFDGYLYNSGVNFRFTRGRLLREEKPASRYEQFCARAADRLAAILGADIAKKRPELTAVLRAMMLGQQGELSEEQNASFMHSGTMHIFSISGLHIAVIAGGLQAMLSLMRLPRAWQLAPALLALWLYVDVSGTAPSAVRAFAMVAFLQTAFVLRVPTNPVASLALSALAVLLVAPLQLFSASFQMSYSIVAVLLLLGLPLADAWQERWSPFRHVPQVTWSGWQRAVAATWRWLALALGIGFASSLAGAVSGVAFFKLLTPGALLVNLALIPLSSLVILAGFLSLLAGLAGLGPISVLFNHAAALLLWVIDLVVRTCLRLPAMWFDAQFKASWMGAVALAVLLATVLAGYQLGWQKRYGGFWPPFIVAAAAMALAVKF
jgi:competence protein ComEC